MSSVTLVQDRVRALDATLQHIIFANFVQMRGLATHHNVFTLNAAGELVVWLVRGPLDAMEQHVAKLERQAHRDPITHREIWTFFQRAGVRICPVSEAAARRQNFIPDDIDPRRQTTTTTAPQRHLIVRCEYVFAEGRACVCTTLFTHDERHSAPDSETGEMLVLVPTVAVPDDAALERLFDRDDVSAVTRHLRLYFQAALHARKTATAEPAAAAAAQQALDHMPRTCDACGQPARRVCGGCRAVRYCTPACQHQAWTTEHKETCSAFGKLIDFIVVEANNAFPDPPPKK